MIGPLRIGLLILAASLASLSCKRFTTPPVPPGVPEEATLNRKASVWEYRAPDGSYGMYYADGSVAARGQYKGGARTGVWKTFLPGGETVATRGHYRGDWRDGTWIFNDDEGKLYLSVEYALEPKREFIFLVTHDYGNENGPYERYFPDGSLEERGSFRAGYMEGPLVRYHSNGKQAVVGQYKKDKKVGVWRYYYPEGNLEREESYQEGVLEGVLRSYYPDGTLYQESRYSGGKIASPPVVYPPSESSDR